MKTCQRCNEWTLVLRKSKYNNQKLCKLCLSKETSRQNAGLPGYRQEAMRPIPEKPEP